MINTVLEKIKPPTYDIDAEGIPKFINTDFIELDKIGYIQRFRTYGYDDSDDFENCRSMKHVYLAFEEYRVNREVKIFSPIDGQIIDIGQISINVSGEWKVETKNLLTSVTIRSSEYPAFNIYIRWLDIRDMGLKTGMEVSEGQHIGYFCMSVVGKTIPLPCASIRVSVNTPDGYKKLSYFQVMTDDVFQSYEDRGATCIEDFIIPREERDADPLTCTYDYGGNFFWIYEKGDIPSWVYLGNKPSDFEIVSDIEY